VPEVTGWHSGLGPGFGTGCEGKLWPQVSLGQ